MTGRDEVLAVVADLSGPLGPFRTPEDMDDIRLMWVSEVDWSAFGHLADIACGSWPELARLDPDAVHYELSRLLTELGQRDVAGAVARLAGLLEVPAARTVAIAALGGFGPAALPALAALVDEPLTVSEAVWLACALGETEDERARPALLALRDRVGAPEVVQEVATALVHLDHC
ncbi:hypothetical protein ABZ816_30845 [Actinosynnema sp. NPDC047251]|uniref:Uncharacterized protein n=1 Tax=Saccharothrix espanaensis (strain ATCC 51144 / DSM 44229 / JCM 9112 / NBRC 15066 / NRRL 15764) TaxID=1179773 RepID=K0K7B7_SACES|nr:hypothetical protein [Saccharothrix espanaensis]CCH32789.1 hypothetical protein BN6_55300 [Saccharothrix espanaensis DSM 44229]